MGHRICSVDGCEAKHEARGWCLSHYMRWLRHGDASATNPVRTRTQGAEADDRFRRHADMSGGQDACWPWTSYLSQDGYGRLWDGKRSVEAYRYAYETQIGPVPQGMVLDHLCHSMDTGCAGNGRDCPHRRCVNPAHLEPVTQEENARRAHRN
jgi:hypothetical protein